MFLLFPAAMFVPLKRDTNMAIYKFGQDIFSNFSHIKNHTDLTLGEAFCILIFLYFPDFELSVLNGLQH